MRNRVPVLGSRRSKDSMPLRNGWLLSGREDLGKREGLAFYPEMLKYSVITWLTCIYALCLLNHISVVWSVILTVILGGRPVVFFILKSLQLDLTCPELRRHQLGVRIRVCLRPFALLYLDRSGGQGQPGSMRPSQSGT